MTTVATHLNECLNCGTLLTGAYCAACGQKVSSPRPTMHELLHDLTHEFLHVDGKIVQSVQLLFRRPGFLTREYVEGRRARYVSPLRLYLIFSVAYFAAAALTAKPPIVTPEDRTAASGFSVQSREEFGRIRVSGDFRGLSPEAVSERIQHAQHDWVPRVMFVLVPIGALLVMAVTRRAHRTYIEHLYFTLHAHATCFAVLASTSVIGLLAGPTLATTVAVGALVFIAWYVCSAFRTTYGGGWWLSLRRTSFVFVTYLFVVALTVVALFVGAIVT